MVFSHVMGRIIVARGPASTRGLNCVVFIEIVLTLENDIPCFRLDHSDQTRL